MHGAQAMRRLAWSSCLQVSLVLASRNLGMANEPRDAGAGSGFSGARARIVGGRMGPADSLDKLTPPDRLFVFAIWQPRGFVGGGMGVLVGGTFFGAQEVV